MEKKSTQTAHAKAHAKVLSIDEIIAKETKAVTPTRKRKDTPKQEVAKKSHAVKRECEDDKVFTNEILSSYEDAVFTAYTKALESGCKAHTPDLYKYIASDTDVNERICELGKWIAFSVLKKLFEKTGGTRMVVKLRRDLAHDIALMRAEKFFADNKKNEDGTCKYVYVQVDPDDPTTVEEIPVDNEKEFKGDALTDASDMLQAAMEEIWRQTILVIDERIDEFCGRHWLTVAHTERVISKRVYIRDDPSELKYKDVEISPIQKAFKASRNVIGTLRHVKVSDGESKKKYVYTEARGYDPQNPVYIRIDQFAASLASGNEKMCIEHGKSNGKVTGMAPTVTLDDTERITRILALANLTARQAEILKYMVLGYGKKAIATRLKVSDYAVLDNIRYIRIKFARLAKEHPEILDPSIITQYYAS